MNLNLELLAKVLSGKKLEPDEWAQYKANASDMRNNPNTQHFNVTNAKAQGDGGAYGGRQAFMDEFEDRWTGRFTDVKDFSKHRQSKEGHAGAGIYSTDDPYDASDNYASIRGADPNERVMSAIEDVRDDGTRSINRSNRLSNYLWQNKNVSFDKPFKELSPWKQSVALSHIGADNIGVVYPLKVRSDNRVHLDDPDRDNLRFEPIETYDEKLDEFVPNEGADQEAWETVQSLLSEYNVPYDDNLQELMTEGGTGRELYDAVKNAAKNGDLYDQLTGDFVSSGHVANQAVAEFGADTIEHTPKFGNDILNQADTHTISLKPKNIRSKFAAFDPILRDDTNILSMNGRGGSGFLVDALKKAVPNAVVAGIRDRRKSALDSDTPKEQPFIAPKDKFSQDLLMGKATSDLVQFGAENFTPIGSMDEFSKDPSLLNAALATADVGLSVVPGVKGAMKPAISKMIKR